MKAIIRVLMLTLAVILLATSLTACAKRVEDGEYILGDKALTGCYDSYTFEKKNFSYAVFSSLLWMNPAPNSTQT